MNIDIINNNSNDASLIYNTCVQTQAQLIKRQVGPQVGWSAFTILKSWAWTFNTWHSGREIGL